LEEPVAVEHPDDAARREMVEEAAQFRAVLTTDGRATKLIQLFDYLLERSADPRAPKEIEVAMSVFGKSAGFDTSQDSMVRAHVYRLRQRLESFNAGRPGVYLHIPKGEYRLLLCGGGGETDGDAAATNAMQPPANHRGIWALIGAGSAASLLLWGLLWANALPGGQPHSAASALGKNDFWRPIATHPLAPVVAASDFYMVAEGKAGHIGRTVMHPLIQSPQELDRYLGEHPELYDALHDRDIYRVPASVAVGAATVLALAGTVRPDGAMGEIVPISQISQNAIDTRDVIYVAPFSQLGKLRSSLLHVSEFEPGADSDEIRNKATGQTFRATMTEEGGDVAPGSAPASMASGYDYGYIASFPERVGNQTIVISGIADTAITQMLRVVADKRQLDVLSQKTGNAKAFEAIYKVRTAGGLVFDTKLLGARPLVASGR